MRIMRRLCGLLFAALALAVFAASPARAQTQEQIRPIVATNVSFFENVQLGNLTLSPVNIFHDTRCPDPEFCFRNNQFAVSVILFTDDGLKEMILRLFESTKVPGGGTLTLTNTGAPPSEDGAIGLEQYRLELVYVPAGNVMPNAATGEDGSVRQRAIPAITDPARA
jgi:hypothetical protein